MVTFGPARDTGTSNLGDDVFEVGRTERLAAEVAERGPFFVQDLVGGGRDLWVQHVGNDPETGWLALGVIIPGDGPRCLALWDTGTEQFESDCDDRVFPPDGTGLTQYPVTIEDGNVLVDINFEARDVPDDPGS